MDGVIPSVAPGSKEGLSQTEQCVHLSSHMPVSLYPEGIRSSPSTLMSQATKPRMIITAGPGFFFFSRPAESALMYSGISNLCVIQHQLEKATSASSVTGDPASPLER